GDRGRVRERDAPRARRSFAGRGAPRRGRAAGRARLAPEGNGGVARARCPVRDCAHARPGRRRMSPARGRGSRGSGARRGQEHLRTSRCTAGSRTPRAADHEPPWALGPRARGSASRRGREDQSRDRCVARHQRAHGGAAPSEHFREARALVPRRGDGFRLRARPRLTRVGVVRKDHTAHGPDWWIRAMPADRGRPTVVRNDKEAEMTAQSFDTVIVGGGQAGLATGDHLKKHGRTFVILDASERVGDPWRRRWDSLRLYSPASYDGLPGLRFPAKRTSYPTAREMADYLTAYAEHFQLPVRSGSTVDTLTMENGRYVLLAGEERYEADNVVVATGVMQKPYVPSFASQ